MYFHSQLLNVVSVERDHHHQWTALKEDQLMDGLLNNAHLVWLELLKEMPVAMSMKMIAEIQSVTDQEPMYSQSVPNHAVSAVDSHHQN